MRRAQKNGELLLRSSQLFKSLIKMPLQQETNSLLKAVSECLATVSHENYRLHHWAGKTTLDPTCLNFNYTRRDHVMAQGLIRQLDSHVCFTLSYPQGLNKSILQSLLSNHIKREKKLTIAKLWSSSNLDFQYVSLFFTRVRSFVT